MKPIQAMIEAAVAASSLDGCVVIGTEHTTSNLRFAANSLTTNGQMTDRSLTMISICDGPAGRQAGVVTRTVTDDDELAALVASSERAARDAAAADDAFDLVDPYPHDDDWDAPPPSTGVEVFADFAPALGRAFTLMDGRDERLYGFAEHELSATWLATSTGVRRRFDQPDGRLELNAKSADLTRSAWAGVHSTDFSDLAADGVDELVDDLHQRLEWARNQIELPAGRYETILPPTAVADLMIYAYWTASARDAEEGRSVFSRSDGGGTSNASDASSGGTSGTRIGDQLSELSLTLRSDPSGGGYDELACAPFEIATASGGGLQSVFDNGAPIRATDWISDGRLAELIRTRNWAARTGAPPRPSAGNLILSGPRTAETGAPRLRDMIGSTNRGLLLTCLWYIREVDPQTLLLTGLTRDGVYLIEDGQVRGAVNNFRFNESPIDLLARITEVGATTPTLPREWGDYFTRAAMPAVRVRDFNMSTVSPAS
jgi:predicted Zn-dependent protease